MQKIFEITEISSLKLLHWPRVFEEVFLGHPQDLGWGPGSEPKIVRDLAAISLMPVQKVIQKLQVIVRENMDIEITLEAFMALCAGVPKPLIVNIDHDCDYLRELGIDGAIDFFAQPFHDFSPRLHQASRTITCSSDAGRAYSAAMELRFLGFKAVFCLCQRSC